MADGRGAGACRENSRRGRLSQATIKVVVPFAAAGVTDIVARVVFDRVSRAVNQTIVIDNRPGAGGTIAIEQVANAAADGYTLVMADPSGSLPANVTLYPKPEVSPDPESHADRDFRHHRGGPSGQQRAAGENRAGSGGAGQEQARRTDVRLDRRRHAGPSQWRAVQPARRHQGRARALSCGRTGGDRFRRRPHLVLDRSDPDHAAERAARAAAAAGGRGRRSDPAICPAFRPSRKPASATSMPLRPMRCLRPPARRRTIVDSSTRDQSARSTTRRAAEAARRRCQPRIGTPEDITKDAASGASRNGPT